MNEWVKSSNNFCSLWQQVGFLLNYFSSPDIVRTFSFRTRGCFIRILHILLLETFVNHSCQRHDRESAASVDKQASATTRSAANKTEEARAKKALTAVGKEKVKDISSFFSWTSAKVRQWGKMQRAFSSILLPPVYFQFRNLLLYWDFCKNSWRALPSFDFFLHMETNDIKWSLSFTFLNYEFYFSINYLVFTEITFHVFT